MNLSTTNRLTLANGPAAYQYQNDPADNLTNQAGASGQVNPLNQLTAWQGASLTHDAAGNLTTDGQWTYRYDAEHRLVTLAAKPPNTATYRFRYDGRGRRVIETALDGTDTRLLWCGEAICQTRTASDVPTKYHYPQGELRGSQRLYYATDHLGSVREVRDLATGQTPAAFDYTAYGAIRAQSGSLTPDRGFAGMWRHSSGLLYLTHYRAYSPAYGRWLSRDPIHEAGGVNLYGYVTGNPVSKVDLLGLLVTGSYDRFTGALTITDVDTGESVTTSAESGGKPFGAPIPPGTYDILERRGLPDFYRLDRKDATPYDDVDSITGRSHFRLHRPGRTTGCIAAKEWAGWARIDELIEHTKTKSVPEKFKPWWKFPPTKPEHLIYYGTLEVR